MIHCSQSKIIMDKSVYYNAGFGYLIPHWYYVIFKVDVISIGFLWHEILKGLIELLPG